jgi:hypothetical protein
MNILKAAVVVIGGCVSFGSKRIKRKSEMLRIAWVQVAG